MGAGILKSKRRAQRRHALPETSPASVGRGFAIERKELGLGASRLTSSFHVRSVLSFNNAVCVLPPPHSSSTPPLNDKLRSQRWEVKSTRVVWGSLALCLPDALGARPPPLVNTVLPLIRISQHRAPALNCRRTAARPNSCGPRAGSHFHCGHKLAVVARAAACRCGTEAFL